MGIDLEMGKLELFRQRIIPNQRISLKDDLILHLDSNVLITAWKTLHPKDEFDHGVSCYFLGSGIKVSKFYRSDNSLLYWYCDIVDYDYDEESGALTVIDLLADVIIHPDGRVQVMDLDELSEAISKNLITQGQLCTALDRLNFLLRSIDSGDFKTMQAMLESQE